MARCNRCEKKGFFLKLNIDGFCKECERIITTVAFGQEFAFRGLPLFKGFEE